MLYLISLAEILRRIMVLPLNHGSK